MLGTTLHEFGSHATRDMGGRTSELANKTFSTADARNDSATRGSLEDVIAVPCHEVAVIDNVLLARLKLAKRFSRLLKQFSTAGTLSLRMLTLQGGE